MTRERVHHRFFRRTAARGFSLIEVLVSSAIFLLIMVAVYTVYQRAQESHKLGVNQADLIQSTRFGFDEMATRIRAAGFEFDLDGFTQGSAQQSDESIEYMGDTAIIVRANYDFASEALRGREPLYEDEPDDGNMKVVTIGNDEILGFALGKDEGHPNPPTEILQAWFDLDAPRDGIITSDGELEGEDLVEIPNVALTDLSDPPYTLYQFTWGDPDAGGAAPLIRRPLVDNIIDLRFEYFDEGGNLIDPNFGAPSPANEDDADAQERSDRARVRKVKIFLRGMTPDPDLRYNDPDDTDPVTRKHRKFELSQEVHTFNVGRRGKKDENLDPPERVQDVQLCSGQCGMVRVDWKPGPPEDRIADHLVILAECDGGSGPNYDDPLASFLVVSDLDLTVTPEREYAVFDVEDNAALVEGTEVCARVIARDQGGTESEPADSDRNSDAPEPTSNDYTVIQDYTRSEAPFGGEGSGYDWEAGNWPNAKADNANSGIRVTTDDSAASYPLANRIELSFQTPLYQLQRTSQGGVAYDWTTDPNVQGFAALAQDADNEACYRVEASPLDAGDDYRTPTEELTKNPSPQRRNLYVFRVSGSDDSNWGPEQAECDFSPSPGPNCIEDVRNFVPYAGNLLAFEAVSLASGSFDFTDVSAVRFAAQEDSTDRYEDRFLSVGTWDVEPEGFASPVKSLTPGEVYYYRIRVTDYCWEDADLNGVEDSTESDPTPLTAWSTRDDFADEDAWRQAAVRISPFYPPMNSQSGSGNLDLPATGMADSDYVDLTNLGSVNTHALPGYAIPTNPNGNVFIRPEKPTEFYLSRANDSTSSLLTSTDVNGDDIPESMGVRVLFNASKRNSPADTNGSSSPPEAVGYTFYRLYRFPLANAPAPGSEVPTGARNFEADAPQAELVAEFRLSEAGLREYTIDRRGEVLGGKNSAVSNSGLDLTTATDHDGDPLTPDQWEYYFYKLFAVQVSDGTWHDALGNADRLPDHVGDDGITPAQTAARLSVGSRGFVFPSDFYDSVAEVDVDPNPPSGLNAQSIDVQVEMGNEPDPMNPVCADVRAARLLAYDYDEGQYLGSSDWIAWPAGCSLSIGREDILDALRGFPDQARFVVELSNVAETGDWDDQPQGQRVRSDLLGSSGDYVLNTTCAIDCGTNSAPNILGTVIDSAAPEDDRIATFDEDRVLSIQPEILPCNTEDFSLLQVEVVLSSPTALPPLIRADLSGLRSGSLVLPDPEFAGNDGGMLYRYRWFEGSFCDSSGVCSFPVVDADSDELDLRLRFAGSVCDPVRLEQFNFRVLVDRGSGLEEMLCSQRGGQAPDNQGGADAPDIWCDTVSGPDASGCGRGPAISPEPCGQNPDCEPACGTDQCPANLNFTVEPDTYLEDSMSGFEDVVRIEQLEDCSEDCALSLTEISVRFECDDRDCSVESLPDFSSAELQHEARAAEPLPPPTVDRDPNDHVELTWTGLTGFEVDPGERFSVAITFTGSMAGTHVTEYHLQFGEPLESLTDCDWVDDADRDPIPVPNSN